MAVPTSDQPPDASAAGHAGDAGFKLVAERETLPDGRKIIFFHSEEP